MYLNNQLIKKCSGQGTIEYLVILAIVVVIALGVVVTVTSFSGSGDGISSTSQSIGQRAGVLAVTESIVSPSGQYALKLVSNESSPVEVKSVFVDDVEQVYTGNNTVITGASRVFPLYLSESCVEGSSVVKTIKVVYESVDGLERTVVLENVSVPCQGYTLTSSNLASVADSSIITLYSPGSGSNLDVGTTVVFNYMATNVGTDTNYCSLLIDGVVDQTTVSPEMPGSFSKLFSSVGSHTWDVECENLLGYVSTSGNGPWSF